jgi:hypothetical protein
MQQSMSLKCLYPKAWTEMQTLSEVLRQYCWVRVASDLRWLNP